MKVALAIFVKTVGLSPTKTRLAKGIGKDNAVDFYRLSYQAIRDTAKEFQNQMKDHQIEIFWSVAEKEALNNDDWQDFPTTWQGDGELGDRLQYVYQELKKDHDAVIFIGADCPQLSAKLLCDAIKLYEEHKQTFVIGPSQDGGYWLFMGGIDLPPSVWLDVPYSCDRTLEAFRGNLKPLAPVYEIDLLRDVDEIDDLIALKNTLKARQTISPSQKQLLSWLDNTLSG